jgi:hypothetical protein
MMNEAVKQCCGKDGKPDFGEMKRFMEKCGKVRFGDHEIEMMKQFCGQEGMPDFEKMKQFMETCGCHLP